MYESFNSESNKSNIRIDPNSVDNDKLHKLKELLLAKRNDEVGNDDNLLLDNEFSHSSKEEMKPKKFNKTLSDMLEENISKKSGSINSIEDLYLKNSMNSHSNSSKHETNNIKEEKKIDEIRGVN